MYHIIREKAITITQLVNRKLSVGWSRKRIQDGGGIVLNFPVELNVPTSSSATFFQEYLTEVQNAS